MTLSAGTATGYELVSLLDFHQFGVEALTAVGGPASWGWYVSAEGRAVQGGPRYHPGDDSR